MRQRADQRVRLNDSSVIAMLALVQVLVAALVLLLGVVLVLASTCIFYHIPMIANNSRLPKQDRKSVV